VTKQAHQVACEKIIGIVRELNGEIDIETDEK